MIQEAIILAGGRGTRLQSVVSDVPKPMADINGWPFLTYQIRYLAAQGIKRIILSVGYKHESIVSFFGDQFEGTPIVYMVEETPLGTGGGLRLALEASETDDVLVCNGDTFFEFRLEKLAFVHQQKASGFTFSVREIENDGRYGGLKIASDCRVEEFIPKNIISKTFINAGVYLVHKPFFMDNSREGQPFSLEDDFLALKLSTDKVFAVPFLNGRFLDIGIPEDYFRSQELIPDWVRSPEPETATIFLDRDGVLNEKIEDGYVTSVAGLKMIDGVEQWLAERVSNGVQLFVITNQRGVGKGLMSLSDLESIHGEITLQLGKHEVTIKQFYFCTDIDNSAPRRKPNPGMLEQAFEEYPGLRKETSVMIGDSLTDLQAASAFGIRSVFLTNGKAINFETLSHCTVIARTLRDVVL